VLRDESRDLLGAGGSNLIDAPLNTKILLHPIDLQATELVPPAAVGDRRHPGAVLNAI
jgi:hypothetical protein